MKKFTIGIGIGFILAAVPLAFATSDYFADVPAGEWYSESVNSLYEKEIVHGYNDGKFHPTNSPNRAEVALMIKKTIDFMEKQNDAKTAAIVTHLLHGQDLFAYSSSARFVPRATDDAGRYLDDIKDLEKAFSVTKTSDFIPDAFTIYASADWKTAKISTFFIHFDGTSLDEGWSGPFWDDVNRLSQEAQTL